MSPGKGTSRKRKIVVLDDSDEELPERTLSGAEVIDLDPLEEQFYAEFEAEQALLPNGAARDSHTRNPAVTFPWCEVDTAKVQDGSLKPGKTVELDDGTFLTIVKVIQSVYGGEVKLRGSLLKRRKDMAGMFQKKVNELCYVYEIFLDDPRPLLVQSLVEVGAERVIKGRVLIRTNYPFPAHNPHFDEKGNKATDDKTRWWQENERLVVRWKYVMFYDNAQEHAKSPKYQGNIRKSQIVGLEEEECTATSGDVNYYLPPDIQRWQWRGDTSLGGSHNAPNRGIGQNPGGTSQKYTYGDSFCCAGGATCGAKGAGLHITWGLDCDPGTGLSWRHNFPDSKHFEMWAHEFVALPGCLQRFIVDILHLSPPCQVFSPVHTREGKNDQQNFASLFACEEIIKKTRPRMITLEQTFGILHPKFKEAFHSLIQMFTSLGYSVSWRTLEFQRYGLPQSRRRLIIIAAAPGESLPDLPAYTHSNDPSDGLKPYKSVRNTLSRIPRNAANHDIEAAKRRGANKVAWDDSGITTCITCDGGTKGHPSGLRDFTEREIATLQSFPFNHIFLGNAIKKQIGNAVPPLIARVIFLAIKQHLERTDGVVRTIVMD